MTLFIGKKTGFDAKVGTQKSVRCHTSKLFLQFWSIFGGENAVRREEESGIVIGEGRP